MTDRLNQDPQADDQRPAEGADRSPRRRLARLADKLLTRKWLGIILGLSVAAHAVGFSFYRLAASTPNTAPEAEISLGEFRFVDRHPASGQVAEADFAIHLALIPEADRAARSRLEVREFRVQQDIEELLRRAHAADFDDPGLAELKHGLQERIDRTLGIRAIAEVIITDLRMQRNPESPARATETAEALPWLAPSAG